MTSNDYYNIIDVLTLAAIRAKQDYEELIKKGYIGVSLDIHKRRVEQAENAIKVMQDTYT